MAGISRWPYFREGEKLESTVFTEDINTNVIIEVKVE